MIGFIMGVAFEAAKAVKDEVADELEDKLEALTLEQLLDVLERVQKAVKDE